MALIAEGQQAMEQLRIPDPVVVDSSVDVQVAPEHLANRSIDHSQVKGCVVHDQRHATVGREEVGNVLALNEATMTTIKRSCQHKLRGEP